MNIKLKFIIGIFVFKLCLIASGDENIACNFINNLKCKGMECVCDSRHIFCNGDTITEMYVYQVFECFNILWLKNNWV